MKIAEDRAARLLAVIDEAEADQADEQGEPQEDSQDDNGDRPGVESVGDLANALGVGELLDVLVRVGAGEVPGDAVVGVLGVVVVGSKHHIAEATAVVVGGGDVGALALGRAGVASYGAVAVVDRSHADDPLNCASQLSLAGLEPGVTVASADGDTVKGGGLVEDGVGPSGLVGVALKVASLLNEELLALGGNRATGRPVVAKEGGGRVVVGDEVVPLGSAAGQGVVIGAVGQGLAGGSTELPVCEAAGLQGGLGGREEGRERVGVVAEGLGVRDLCDVLVGVVGGEGKVPDDAVFLVLGVVEGSAPEEIADALGVLVDLTKGLAGRSLLRGAKKKVSRKEEVEWTERESTDGGTGVVDGFAIDVIRDKVIEPLDTAGHVVLASLKPGVAVAGANRNTEELGGRGAGGVSIDPLVGITLKVARLSLEEAQAGGGQRPAAVPVETIKLSSVGTGHDPTKREKRERSSATLRRRRTGEVIVIVIEVIDRSNSLSVDVNSGEERISFFGFSCVGMLSPDLNPPPPPCPPCPENPNQQSRIRSRS